MVIVFHFTCKLMDLGIPDVDAQNPLWSPSGDLSSLGCLWCTRISAEVICELLHTKSRFLREEAQAHTHPPPSPPRHPPPPHPAPGSNVQGPEEDLPISQIPWARQQRQGLLLRAELCWHGLCASSQGHRKGLWVLLSPTPCWDRSRQLERWTCSRLHGPHLSSLFLLYAAGHGRGHPPAHRRAVPFASL